MKPIASNKSFGIQEVNGNIQVCFISCTFSLNTDRRVHSTTHICKTYSRNSRRFPGFDLRFGLSFCKWNTTVHEYISFCTLRAQQDYISKYILSILKWFVPDCHCLTYFHDWRLRAWLVYCSHWSVRISWNLCQDLGTIIYAWCTLITSTFEFQTSLVSKNVHENGMCFVAPTHHIWTSFHHKIKL